MQPRLTALDGNIAVFYCTKDGRQYNVWEHPSLLSKLQEVCEEYFCDDKTTEGEEQCYLTVMNSTGFHQHGPY